MGDKAKFHHLIPQTYLSEWTHGKNTLYTYNIEDNKMTERNKENICGIKYFHAIKAGMPMVTQADADIIFSCLKPYKVFCNEKKLSNSLEYNQYYYDFSNWKIFREDGSVVSKKRIKHEIDQIKINEIEEKWSELYETKWNEIKDEIKNRILKSRNGYIEEFQRDYLMRFFVALDWRGFKSNMMYREEAELILESFEDTEIPEAERILPDLKTAKEELIYEIRINAYRKFLNEDENGMISKMAEFYKEKLQISFFVIKNEKEFLTSDNLAFIFTNDDGYKEHILPITPKILMRLGKNSDVVHKYYVFNCSNEEVEYYNKKIIENCEEIYISKYERA